MHWTKTHKRGVVVRRLSKAASHRVASENANWRGGRYLSNGYVFVYAPDHVSARKGYVAEHRLKLERKLGRALTSREIVHHVNGNKADNRLANLQLTTSAEHARHHNQQGNPFAGQRHTDDARCRSGDVHRGKRLTSAHRAKLSAAKKGRPKTGAALAAVRRNLAKARAARCER